MQSADVGGPVGADRETVAVRAVVLELEKVTASAGWDQPARLFALVRTERLLADQPDLARMLEVDPDADLTGSLTPVEQDDVPSDQHLEAFLTELAWPPAVHGAAVVVERLVLPPSVELPEDDGEAQQIAATHPDRQDVRMVAAATREGATYCALRLRSHDEDLAVVQGVDLVPALLELLQATLAPDRQPEPETRDG
jgi:hypothetical protein